MHQACCSRDLQKLWGVRRGTDYFTASRSDSDPADLTRTIFPAAAHHTVWSRVAFVALATRAFRNTSISFAMYVCLSVCLSVCLHVFM
jgi:hypothetical protein